MWRLVPVLCACAALLVACGGEEQTPTRTVRVQAGEPVRIAATEYAFDPGGLVMAGPGRLRITLDNRGSLAHNIKVLDGERDLGGTESFAGGEERSATVRLGQGEYRLVCTVGDHEDQGMVGTVEVR